jgi:hypothetical protein
MPNVWHDDYILRVGANPGGNNDYLSHDMILSEISKSWVHASRNI